MYYIKTEAAFDSAHFLKGYRGKCSNLHGHRWRVAACVKAQELLDDEQTRGMVADFGDIKASLKKICDDLDHCFIYEKGSLKSATIEALEAEGFRLVEVGFRPTAENLARHIFELLAGQGFEMDRVEVYETPGNCAVYEGS